jgi:Flp pilus assembly protein TadG
MISSFPAKNRKSQRGAALVEYAFVLIFFLTLLFGIGGFGHFLYVYHAISNAAKEGTRWASVNGKLCNDDSSCNGANGMNTGPASPSQIEAHTLAALPASVNQSQATITAAFTHPAGSPDVCTSQVTAVDGTLYGPFDNYPGCTVTVQVAYTYNLIFPLINIGPINLSTTSEMVIAH